MKFYLIEVSTGDPKIAGKAIYEYATLKEAEAVFHSKMGAAMKSDLFATELLCVINGVGGVYPNLNLSYTNTDYAAPDQEIEDETPVETK